MSEQANHDEHGSHHDINYVGVWVVLVLLLVVSVVGPMFEIQWLTLITAFGITFEKKYILMMLTTMLLFMGLFVAGVSPDVRKHEGRNWSNDAAKAEIERALAAQGETAARNSAARQIGKRIRLILSGGPLR